MPAQLYPSLPGLDVSRHQGAINWNAVANAGHRFAICKATDGTSYGFTGYYTQQVTGMRAAGIKPGAYHWLTARDDPSAQARFFVRTIGDTGGLLCALDVERSANGEEPTVAQARAFAQEFARLTGGHPLILYTGRWYWVTELGNPHGADLGPLWHSEYDLSAAEIADGPELDRYGGWDTGCTIWQYTSSGSCPGIVGNVDLNIFYGDEAALAALAGVIVDPPPPSSTPQEGPMYLVQFSDGDKWFACGPWGRFWLTDPFVETWVQAHLMGGGQAHFNGTPANPQPLLWDHTIKNIYAPVRPGDDD